MESIAGLPIIGKRYILHHELGHGGMGTVFRATDRLMGVPVALKRVLQTTPDGSKQGASSGHDQRLALAQEFKVLASLRHPNIISVLDYGFDEDRQPYYTMELIQDARTILEASIDQPLERQVDLLAQMLQALVYLHRRGVIHRDLKPRNVLVTREKQVKLLDFGLSVAGDAGESASSTAGTLAYMAPEVLMGGRVSEASDLYALGVIAYELFSGKHPFDDGDVTTLLNNILYASPPMALLNIDPRLAAVIERLMSRSPESRYRSAREALVELGEAIGQPIQADTAATRESFLQAARLVGRESEVSTLSAALDAAINGKGSAWLIGGESGVGKSRLLDEARALALVRGAHVLRGQAIADSGAPYQTWRAILRWLALLTDLSDEQLGVLHTLMPDIGALVGRDFKAAEALDVKAAQQRLLDVIEAMFRQQKGPVAVFLEDLHWASESLDVLRRVSALTRELPLIIIASYRDDERPELPALLPDMNLLRLERLSEAGIAQLSAAMLGENGSQPQVVELLQRETEGNVFFLIEVVRVLAEEAGTLERIGMVTLPAQVFVGGMQRIIQRRLSRLPADVLPLVQLAAVAGRYLDLELLRRLEPDVNFERWLTLCSDAAVLEVQDGEWRFAHDKLRDGVLNELPVDLRRELHGRVAAGVEALYPGDPDAYWRLAYHYGQAGSVRKEAQYTELAGQQALRTGAYRDAIRFFERALELTIKLKTTRVHELRILEISLKRQIADAHLGLGQYTTARTLLRENLNSAWALKDDRSTAAALIRLGDVAAALNEYSEARTYYQECLELYRKLDDRVMIARALNNLGSVLYETGDEDAARRLFQESLNVAREAGSGWGLAGALRGGGGQKQGFEAAREVLERALSEYQASRERGKLAAAIQQFNQATEGQGQFGAAQPYYQELFARFERAGDPWGAALTLSYLGRAATASSDLNGARAHLINALKKAQASGEMALALDILAAAGRLLIDLGRKAEAVELLAQALHHPDSSEETQDEAERLLFRLEDELDPAALSASWERGKTRPFSASLNDALSWL